MKSTLHDIILLCKGWYDTDKYDTVHAAIRAYYDQQYSDTIVFNDDEHAMFNLIMKPALRELADTYPDRLRMFIINDITSDTNGPYTDSNDYDTVMYYRIIKFFKHLVLNNKQTLVKIDVDDYFTNKESMGNITKVLKEPIIN